MAFFSRSHLKARLSIQFSSEADAFVEVDPPISSESFGTAVQLFCWYYAKNLCNLGVEDNTAETLIEAIDAFARHVLRSDELNEVDCLPSDVILRDHAPKGVIKTYSGRLIETSGQTAILTDMSVGGEGYYSPLSVLLLLQHICASLEAAHIQVLCISIVGMHKYYAEHGWTRLPSINEAPVFGLKMAADFVRQHKRT